MISSDLRLRIAGSSGLYGLVNEILASKKRSVGSRTTILAMILLLTLAGKPISIIVTSGIKASLGPKYEAPVSFVAKAPEFQKLNLPTRGNSSSMLTSLYNWHQKSDVQGTIFETLSNSSPGRIFDITNRYIGTESPSSPNIPGQFYLIRELYVFSNPDVDPSCDPTSPNCSLMSLRTNISEFADLGRVFDAPITVRFNGESILYVQPARATANLYHEDFLAERPVTEISASFDVDIGTSGYVAVTTASFQTRLSTSQDLVNAAQALIGSANPIYPSIFIALNASAFTPPLISFRASTKATLVYNSPTPKSDNTSLVHCVGYEASRFISDHSIHAENMISCREIRFSVWTNTGSISSFDSDNDQTGRTHIFSIYNAMAPTLTELNITDENPGVESLDAIAQEMSVLSKEISDRLYPLNSKVSGRVTSYSYVEGIVFELWSLIFIGAVLVIVLVIALMDIILNDAITKADLATLIENTTEAHEMSESGKNIDWKKSEYPPWALVKNGKFFHMTLRQKRIELEGGEFQNLNKSFP
ncbi:hypothetical protein BGZ95_000798 [Linnemannia exigua]|uniref:Uncharacterized protein n=1 Tax=Linnemannia exigua TaxID=604196 RepID=A0AAD4H376_9FUNG|nr:hypothetical protein BGZ95_000798 [Linnemannia exigua]